MLFFDLFLLILLLWGLVRGVVKGFVCEAMSLVGVILGVYLARGYSLQLGESLGLYLGVSTLYTRLVAYIIIFVLTVFLCKVLSKMLSSLVKWIFLGWLNRLLGGAFGFIKVMLILSLLLNVFAVLNEKTALLSKEKQTESYLYQPLKSFIPKLLPFINAEDFISPVPVPTEEESIS